MYDDIRKVIDAAFTAGFPVEYTLATPAQATAWRHQFYRYRKKAQRPQLDALVLTLPKGSCTITITEVQGTLTKAGEKIATPNTDILADLRKELGIEE